MKSKGLLIGLGIFAALLALAYWDNKHSQKEEETRTREEKILHFDPDKVTSLALSNNNGEFVLEKDPATKTWRMIKPVGDSADDDAIKAVLNTLSEEKYDQIASDGEADLKIYGLEATKTKLSILLDDQSKQTVLLGNDSPLPGKLYLVREGEKKVLFANTAIRAQVEKTSKDLRDKKIFKFDRDLVAEISLENAKADDHSKIHLIKNDKGWVLEGTLNELAEGDAVLGYLNSLEAIRATGFASENAGDPKERARLGLNKPEIQGSFVGKDKKALLKFATSPKRDNFAYVVFEGKPTVYQVYSSALDQVHRKPDDFRDRKGPFEFAKDQVEHIDVKTGLAQVSLVRKNGVWESAMPLAEGKEVNQAQVGSFLERAQSLRVQEFLGLQPGKGLNPPKGKVGLKNAKGELLLDFSWGEKMQGKNNYFAKSNKGKETYGVDQVAVDNLPLQTLISEKAKEQPSPSPKANAAGSPAQAHQ